MGDQVFEASTRLRGGRQNAPSASQSSCPCCSFLPESAFVPQSRIDGKQYDQSDGHALIDAVTAMHELAAAYNKNSNQSDQSSSDDTTCRKKVLLVDTHGHAHLDRERHETYIDPEQALGEIAVPNIVSLTCAIQESDWNEALEYAAQSNSILPGLGVHPWYLADLSDTWLIDLESLLIKHPAAIVGEIGLDKTALFVRKHPEGKQAALARQRQAFQDQMRLAGKLKRPVSVHCVKQHGVFMNALKELVQEGTPFPTAIGMHSFTGTAHHVKDILQFENDMFPGERLFYFGFSHIVNYEMCTSEKSRRQGREAVCAVPSDRLMAESDVHAAQDVAVGTAGSIAYIANSLQEPLLEVALMTAVNGLAFLNTGGGAPLS